MRNILFKAKRIDNGEWVQGYYCEGTCNSNCGISLIITELNVKILYRSVLPSATDIEDIRDFDIYEVDEKTICQYTGLKDKNGNKIWENDIVELYDTNNNYKWKAIVKFGNPNATYNWGYQLHPIGQYKVNTDILLWVEMEDTGTICEVIGNVFDNPELLNYVDNEESQQAHQEVLKSATE